MVKHVPISISVSISSNIKTESYFICNSDLRHLFAFLIGAPEGVASQGKTQMKLLFLDIMTTKKIKQGSICEKLTQRHNRREQVRFDMSQDGCENEYGTSV